MLRRASPHLFTDLRERGSQLLLISALELTDLFAIDIEEELGDACNAECLATVSALCCVHCCKL